MSKRKDREAVERSLALIDEQAREVEIHHEEWLKAAEAKREEQRVA